MRSVALARATIILSALLLLSQLGCATTQVQRARQVSVNVHSVLAALDDAERAVCNPQPSGECQSAVPSWTTAKHREFSTHMVTALKAGQALNTGVRTVPMAPEVKADLATVTAAVNALTPIIAGVFPPQSAVVVALTAAKDVILKLLPLFLE